MIPLALKGWSRAIRHSVFLMLVRAAQISGLLPMAIGAICEQHNQRHQRYESDRHEEGHTSDYEVPAEATNNAERRNR